MSYTLPTLLNKIAQKKDLTYNEAAFVFNKFMEGTLTSAQMGGVLMGLRTKGETYQEILAAATAMRNHAHKIQAPKDAIDIVGTGGDGASTYNISTTTAIVTAACGVPVAKHGNKAVSSLSGSADILWALGVHIMASKEQTQNALKTIGLAFIMAPLYHPAMRHVAPVRQELKIRTIFNLLGPLTNPASPPFGLIGVFSKDVMMPVAQALQQMGMKKAWVVHGEDGLDEITITGPTYIIEVTPENIRPFSISPQQAGLATAPSQEITGGSVNQNKKALLDILAGNKNAYRDMVVLNTAAALVITGKVQNLKDGAYLAKQAIDDGKAQEKLQSLIDIMKENENG